MIVTGKTKVCGLFGCPVAHSLSPAFQNFIAERMGIDQIYVPFYVEPQDIAAAYEGVRTMHLLGVNATIPHKMELVPLVQEIDEMAAHIGAVNTLVRKGEGYKGYNTDYTGIQKALAAEGMDAKDRSALLLGAGGAAQAVGLALAAMGVSDLTIVNRSLDKAQALAEKIRGAFPSLPIEICDFKGLSQMPGDHFLAIQTTSVGMHPFEGVSPIEDEAFYDRIDLAMDIIYSPSETEFMRQVRAHGGKAANGLRMLLFQGTDAFELWNELVLPQDVIDACWEYMKELAGEA